MRKQGRCIEYVQLQKKSAQATLYYKHPKKLSEARNPRPSTRLHPLIRSLWAGRAKLVGVGTPRAGSKRRGLILDRDLYGSFEGALRELEGLDTWGLNDPNRVSGHVI